MLRLSKHGGQGLYARPFDRLRVTAPYLRMNSEFAWRVHQGPLQETLMGRDNTVKCKDASHASPLG